MKLWHLAVTIAVAVFCLPFAVFDVYLRHKMIKAYGKNLGISMWKEWRLWHVGRIHES